MSRPVHLRHGAASDVGRVRTANEDSCLTAPPVYVVADGMGGHAHGDVASRIVVEEFDRMAATGLAGISPDAAVQLLRATFRTIQQRIASYDAEQRAAGDVGSSSGSTAVVAVMVEQAGLPWWLLANIGDSRIYRFDGGRLLQVSVDHSVVQELVDAGSITPEEAVVHPQRNVITRALGVTSEGEADYFLVPLSEAERIVLCSDGVSGMLDAERMARVLAGVDEPGLAASALVAAAVEAGGRDNATAVVIDVMGLAHHTVNDSTAERSSLQERLEALP